jgi:hypothetical protein
MFKDCFVEDTMASFQTEWSCLTLSEASQEKRKKTGTYPKARHNAIPRLEKMSSGRLEAHIFGSFLQKAATTGRGISIIEQPKTVYARRQARVATNRCATERTTIFQASLR